MPSICWPRLYWTCVWFTGWWWLYYENKHTEEVVDSEAAFFQSKQTHQEEKKSFQFKERRPIDAWSEIGFIDTKQATRRQWILETVRVQMVERWNSNGITWCFRSWTIPWFWASARSKSLLVGSFFSDHEEERECLHRSPRCLVWNWWLHVLHWQPQRQLW